MRWYRDSCRRNSSPDRFSRPRAPAGRCPHDHPLSWTPTRTCGREARCIRAAQQSALATTEDGFAHINESVSFLPEYAEYGHILKHPHHPLDLYDWNSPAGKRNCRDLNVLIVSAADKSWPHRVLDRANVDRATTECALRDDSDESGPFTGGVRSFAEVRTSAVGNVGEQILRVSLPQGPPVPAHSLGQSARSLLRAYSTHVHREVGAIQKLREPRPALRRFRVHRESIGSARVGPAIEPHHFSYHLCRDPRHRLESGQDCARPPLYLVPEWNLQLLLKC